MIKVQKKKEFDKLIAKQIYEGRNLEFDSLK